MKKTEMLKKNYEFKKVLTKGKFLSKEKIGIVVLKNNKNINFLGIAVSTKNGKSFLRNKAKRLIRESYKILEKRLIQGNSIVILLKKNVDIKNLKFKEVFYEMEELFKDAQEVFYEMKELFKETKIIKKEDVL